MAKIRREQVEARKGKHKKTKKGQTFAKNLSKSEQFRNMSDHRIPIEDLLKKLGTSEENGLSQSRATELNKNLGDNSLTEKLATPWYVKFFHEVTDMFSLLLWSGGILCFIAYVLNTSDPSNLYLGIVLIAIVLITTSVTTFQNAKSEAIMQAFKNMVPPKTRVLRDGEWKSIEATKVVIGDIVNIKLGDKIPADIRIIQSKEMKVDNSSLTGETDLLLRTTECTHPDNPLETANLAFFGTLCKEGEGKGVVISIGDSTVIGQIANLASAAAAEITPIKRELDLFTKYILFIAAFLGLLFFSLGFVVGYDALTNFISAIGITVSNVPGGLLAAIPISLAITAKKLAKNKVLVRNMQSVETLGSTSCICSDKTGTLTQNIMTVQHLWYDNKLVKADNKQLKKPDFNFEYKTDSIGFRYLHECAVVCSEAFFNNSTPEAKYEVLKKIANPEQREKEKLRIDQEYQESLKAIKWVDRATVGDASETGLIKFFQPIEDITTTRRRYPCRINDDKSESKIPFNSNNKFAIHIVEYPTQDSDYCLFVKGAPERVWNMCDKLNIEGRMCPIDENIKKDYASVNLTLAKKGERVLGFAKLHLPRQEFPKGFNFHCMNVDTINVPLKGLNFLGLISLMDPPRENVPYSVLKCKAAGIKVIMVTGDQPITAAAIARQVNIISEKTAEEIAEEEGIPMELAMKKANAIVIHGDQLAAAMREDEGLPESERGRKLASWLQKPQIVFARTSPAQKLTIVAGCQRLGHIVAVTGDGVNDSPAIKKADIGIAMGITGSEVAKDAADMVLLSDDFSAIIIGVEEGRKIFDNFKKVIVYCLISNIAQLAPFTYMVIFQFPLPLSSILVLCIGIGTDLLPSVSFSYEEGELNVITRNPRHKTDHLVTKKLIIYSYVTNGIMLSLCGMIPYFVVMHDFGWDFWGMFYTGQIKGIPPLENDTFDETLPNFGNSNAKCIGSELKAINNAELRAPDWLYLQDQYVDLRLFYLTCSNGVLQRNIKTVSCSVPQLSSISLRPACYTTESLKYAQSAYFYGVVWSQVSNAALLKTRFVSIKYQGLSNFFMIFGFHFEISLMLLVAYCYPFNLVLGTRDNVWYHLGIHAMPMSMLMLISDEIRKYLIRNFPKPKPYKPNWFERNSLW